MSNKKEIWKAILLNGKKPNVPYMISNQGRFGVLKKSTGKVEVRTFKASGGYYRSNTRHKGRNKAIFLFKETANAFLKKPSALHRFVIHKDHNYLNDRVENLKWATASEHRLHTAQSPNSVLARKQRIITQSSHSKVLNEKTVKELKRMIWDPKRKLSYQQIAEKFGVSEMQIYRIKNGEFWFHIRVENEPLHPKYLQNLKNIDLLQNKKKTKQSKMEKNTPDKEKKKHKKEKKSKKEKKKRKEEKHKTKKHKKKHKHAKK